MAKDHDCLVLATGVAKMSTLWLKILLSGAGDYEPDALIASWLTWCDFLVETARLDTRSASPRDVRAAVEDVAELLRDPMDPVTAGPMRAMITAMIRDGIEADDTDAVRSWMQELVDSPDRVSELVDSIADAEDGAARALSQSWPLPPMRTRSWRCWSGWPATARSSSPRTKPARPRSVTMGWSSDSGEAASRSRW
jgi:hypothetical protein